MPKEQRIKTRESYILSSIGIPYSSKNLLGYELREKALNERFTPQEKRFLARRLYNMRFCYPECRTDGTLISNLRNDSFFRIYPDYEFTILMSQRFLQKVIKNPGPIHITGKAEVPSKITAVSNYIRTLNQMGNGILPHTFVTSYFPLQRGDRYQRQTINPENGTSYYETVPMIELISGLEANGVKRIFVIDSHSPAFSFFCLSQGIHVIELSAIPLMFKAGLKNEVFTNNVEYIPVAGDDGASEMGYMGRDLLRAMGFECDDLVQGTKTKTLTTKGIDFENNDLARVRGKVAVIVEDIISTGGTMELTILKLLDAGASRVIILATYPIFAGTKDNPRAALDRLSKYDELTIITTDGREPLTDISKAPNIIQADLLTTLPEIAKLDQKNTDFWGSDGKEKLIKMGLALAPWMTYNFNHKET